MEKPADTQHPIHDLLQRRWSPRSFSSQLVPDDSINSVLEAARWSPSCFNQQPWRFIVARATQKEDFSRMLDCLVPANKEWAGQAPVLMMAVAHTTFENGKNNAHAWHDVGQAAACLTIQATALGLFVHQMAGIDRDKIGASYTLPEHCEPVTIIALGYPGDFRTLPEELREREHATRVRREFDAFVFDGDWPADVPN